MDRNVGEKMLKRLLAALSYSGNIFKINNFEKTLNKQISVKQ